MCGNADRYRNIDRRSMGDYSYGCGSAIIIHSDDDMPEDIFSFAFLCGDFAEGFDTDQFDLGII
jgi:hypothetical protein